MSEYPSYLGVWSTRIPIEVTHDPGSDLVRAYHEDVYLGFLHVDQWMRDHETRQYWMDYLEQMVKEGRHLPESNDQGAIAALAGFCRGVVPC